MKRIAPEIERLMWLVAENRDPKAIADFEQRFPELRYELCKRIAMISGLKVAGRSVAKPPAIPRFAPKSVPQAHPARAWYVLAAAAMCVVAFASYSVAVLGRHPSNSLPTVTPVNTAPPEAPPESRVVYKDPTGGQSDSSVPPSQNSSLPIVDPLDRPIDVTIEGAPLGSALSLIGAKAGLQVDVAPGLAEQLVDVDFAGASPKEIFAQLGSEYGFTAFPQEKGKVLIIPARANGSIEAREEGDGSPAQDSDNSPAGSVKTSKTPTSN